VNVSSASLIIGIMGGHVCSEGEARQAYRVGQMLAEKGIILLCGGRGGVMESAARGAAESGGMVLGILPGRNPSESPPNPYVSIPIFTGLGDARNVLNVLSSDGIIAIGGGWGTLSEIALARKNGKPVVLLHSWKLAHPLFPIEDVLEAENPEDAVHRILTLANLNHGVENG